jgi:hypothetical protein
MEKLPVWFELLPFVGILSAGVFSILEVIFPSLGNPNSNHWEIDEGRGTYVQAMGWRKVFTPPRVLAQGYMANRAACGVALVVGIVFIAIATVGIRHVSGFPEYLPDFFAKF